MENQFYTDDYINESYPDHCRTSCCDAHPINASVDGHGCRRCNALMFQREEWQATVVAAAKNLRAQKGRHNTEIAYNRLMAALDDEPTHNYK